jgi:hypothetical protein
MILTTTLAAFFVHWKTSNICTKIFTTINGLFMSLVGAFSVMPTVVCCLDENRERMRIANYSLFMGSGALFVTGISSVVFMCPYIALVGYISALTVIPYGYYVMYYV